MKACSPFPALVFLFALFPSLLVGEITLNSHQYLPVTDAAIGTAGTSDWGFVSVRGGFFDSNLEDAGLSYSETAFDALTKNDGTILTTVSGTSTIGPVELTEGTTGFDAVSPQSNDPPYTFDGLQAYGSYGNFAPNEADVWRLTFNDLGVGQHVIRLYMGHSANNRVFNMDISFDGGANTVETTVSPQIGDLGSTIVGYAATGSSFIYEIDVNVTAASDDLTLTFGGTSGSFGGAIFAGYTVVTNPGSGGGGALEITGISYSPATNEVTLTWNSNEAQSYLVRFSEDLSVLESSPFSQAVPADAGDSTTTTIALEGTGPVDFSKLFFRVEEAP